MTYVTGKVNNITSNSSEVVEFAKNIVNLHKLEQECSHMKADAPATLLGEALLLVLCT